MKKRKKGAIAVYSLFIIIALLVFSSILINMTQGLQMVSRMKQAAEEGAKVRAQAIDILLKEQEGLIEILHDSAGYDDNVNHNEHSDVSGHVNPEMPQSAKYQNAKRKADDFARESVIDYVKNSIHTDSSQKKRLANVSANDICFDFQPLPDGSVYDEEFDPETADKSEINKTYKIDFSCTTPNGDTIKAYDVQVSGVKKNTVKVGEKNGKIETVKATNIVFIGMKFEYSYFFNKTFKDFGAPSSQTGEVWAVAYPQVDKCVRSDASCNY